MSGWDGRGNGLAAWDDAYLPGGVWDQHNGGPRTRAFGVALLGFLDPVLHDYLSQPGRTMLDWGCGLGEIVALLREKYPEAVVAGMDFSLVAVMRAREAFGEPFLCDEEIADEYDVIIASNVHEHFVDYMGLMETHMAKAKDYYVVLTPLEEYLGDGESMTIAEREAAGHAHVHRFSLESFPQEMGEWYLFASGVVTPGPLWPGQQLALIYRRHP